MRPQNGLVQQLWSDCRGLRDGGLSYGGDLEQLTYQRLRPFRNRDRGRRG